MDQWIDGCFNGWIMDGWMDGWIDGWIDQWIDGWFNGWMNGSMDGWMYGSMDWYIIRYTFHFGSGVYYNDFKLNSFFMSINKTFCDNG